MNRWKMTTLASDPPKRIAGMTVAELRRHKARKQVWRSRARARVTAVDFNQGVRDRVRGS